MNILSLFDWISCGRLALERAWIQVDKYFASEVDKYAIQIAKKNYPDTIHIGSVTDVTYYNDELLMWDKEWDNSRDIDFLWPIDMIIWWSPCQDLSIAKKDWKWLQWEKSWLFFEYVRLLKEVKPKYFLLENVASMKKADKEEITRVLTEVYPDVQCYLINSALVSAQNRNRLYWTNIQWVEQPEDKGIVLRDILEKSVGEKYVIDRDTNGYKENANCLYQLNSAWKFRQGYEIFKDEAKTYSLNCSHAWNTMVRVWQFNSGWQWDRVYYSEWKSVSLSANGGGCWAKTGLYSIYNQAFHEDKAMSLGSNSQCATAKTWQIVIQPPIIRKLTPIECERLQTLPDNWTEWISNTQRYKAIWNGWTVDVIAHILKYLSPPSSNRE